MIICGDALTELRKLPDESIHCCVTSPPYWGLRDYGVPGQLGLERTPEEYVARMVEVFREVRRVLRKDGVLWLNLGDTYSAHKDCKSVPDSLRVGGRSESANVIAKGQSHSRDTKLLKSQGLKNKDLIGIPWRVAFALQADGWWLRQDIIWAKPNPMPESVTDRCTKAHEYIFMLTKSARYWYDAEAVKEPFSDERMGNPGKYKAGLKDCVTPMGVHGRGVTGEGWNADGTNSGRNLRSVWTITTKPFKEAHFATFPPEIPELCIKAGCPKGGTMLDPFFGAGTTGMVAKQLGRDFIGIELNPKYCEMAERRIAQVGYQHGLEMVNA